MYNYVYGETNKKKMISLTFHDLSKAPEVKINRDASSSKYFFSIFLYDHDYPEVASCRRKFLMYCKVNVPGSDSIAKTTSKAKINTIMTYLRPNKHSITDTLAHRLVLFVVKHSHALDLSDDRHAALPSDVEVVEKRHMVMSM
jgi:hypothetical protein